MVDRPRRKKSKQSGAIIPHVVVLHTFNRIVDFFCSILAIGVPRRENIARTSFRKKKVRERKKERLRNACMHSLPEFAAQRAYSICAILWKRFLLYYRLHPQESFTCISTAMRTGFGLDIGFN